MPISFAPDADRPTGVQVHLDLLARLHFVLGAFGVLAGISLAILAGGTRAALRHLQTAGPAGDAGVGILALCGGFMAAGGLLLLLAGHALDRRQRAGRFGALALAVPNLVVVPFGTALSVYAFWVLLNDEARREFGRPPRNTGRPGAGAAG
jgi:hypothetical protein